MNCQPQQHQADIADVLIHRINQVFLIKHLLYIRILPDFLLYLGDAVRIGVAECSLISMDAVKGL